MIALLLGLLVGRAEADPAIMAAAEAELERAMSLKLPDQPSPYLVSIEVLDGNVATTMSSFGGTVTDSQRPHRSMRAEVRVGDYKLDNSNFNASFGERGGIISRDLPHEAVPAALRRELWLALDRAYKGATEQMAAKMASLEGRPPSELPDLLRIDPLVTEPVAPVDVDAERIRTITTALTARLAAAGGMEEADSIARDWQGVRILCSSEGHRAWLPTGYTVVRIEGVTRAPDGSRLRDSRSWVARTPDDLPPLDEMLAEVDEMARWLALLREAPIEEDYLGPVVFAPEAAVELFRQVMLNEITGTPPSTEAPDEFMDPTPLPSARLGRRLLPEGWTVTDDPSRPGHAGSYTHDHEGVPAQPVSLVEDGVVRDLLMSRIPRKDVVGPNGHGRAIGLDRRVGLPSVAVVRPRRSKKMRKLERRGQTLARQAGRDYVLVIGMMEPPALAEDFRISFSGEGPLPGITRPLEAWRLYPDGRTEPVRGLEFIGVDRRTLRDIALAGPLSEPADLMDAAPGSGRYSVGSVGGLPTTWSAPAVVITEMELRGSGGSEPRVLSPPPLAAD
ncbi:MAG: hypothetical protein ACI8S6_005756 [Myxococcota bacterium]|jgi:hypothetical protein